MSEYVMRALVLIITLWTILASLSGTAAGRVAEQAAANLFG